MIAQSDSQGIVPAQWLNWVVVDFLTGLPSEKYSFIADPNAPHIGDVDHGLIHGHPPQDGAAAPADENLRAVAERPHDAIGITRAEDRDHRVAEQGVRAPVAYRRAAGQFFDETPRGCAKLITGSRVAERASVSGMRTSDETPFAWQAVARCASVPLPRKAGAAEMPNCRRPTRAALNGPPAGRLSIPPLLSAWIKVAWAFSPCSPDDMG